VVEQAKMVESAIAQAESFAGKAGGFGRVIRAIQKSACRRMFDAAAWRIRQATEVSASIRRWIC
jgi:hypothetical protein